MSVMEGPSSMMMNVVDGGDYDVDHPHDYIMDLPPGFRFHPTDEEIITHYLTEKVMNGSFSARAVGEVDLNKCEPWDLPKKAKMGEKEWYFFCQRDRKYPTGMRTNRATESGYWKATGKDKEIYKKGRGGSLVGMKKTLVFYKGRAPKGEKTNWVMHEYRLEGQFSYYNFPKPAKDEWVVCRVFHKNTGIRRSPISTSDGLTRMNSSSFVDDLLTDYPSMPPLMEPPNYSNSDGQGGGGSSFTDGGEEETNKGKATASTSSAPPPRIASSDGAADHYLSYFSSGFNDEKNHFIPHTSNYNLYMPDSTNFYPQIPVPNPAFNPYLQTSQNLGYLHQQAERMTNYQQSSASDKANMVQRAHLAMKQGASEYLRQCKMEQPSSNNQSMVTASQDTGHSTDVVTTAETSSVISKKDMGTNTSYNEDIEDPNSVGPISDNLDYDIWNY